VDVEIKVVLFLPRDGDSVPVTRNLLDGCLETLGVTPDIRTDIALALTEACANVIQHAGPGEKYEVQVSAKDCRCAIEVVNTSGNDGEPVRVGAIAVTSDPVPEFAEHGRGLKIIDAVADNLRLSGNDRQGTIVHFEKTLKWLPGAAGEHLINTDRGR
jgi:serine/threonine-protein kinase RsbW